MVSALQTPWSRDPVIKRQWALYNDQSDSAPHPIDTTMRAPCKQQQALSQFERAMSYISSPYQFTHSNHLDHPIKHL
ncbi:hypothetical protein XH83_38835 (plasmid) [Bradyrhizobium sp. CCBAU 53351]|uniref:Uncharacterized protein n=2 Tax=Bradyrhizobium TaxID=374 RepID=A0AAE6CCJ1_9BRAD|nr:hypothetical protein X265_37145 [Bradyrhizobium guangdongense]QAU50784.1 hypothetical protein XH91_36355 [Bradyrhizobium guangzhouense]QOZ49626.1 hypothetical protein XH89_39905 [Bradyrhizobium sp. CCBAU 53340]QOZ56742.1 hypothetical protein XH90_35695 [Bradyrhizobium sp. CCBAU 53338]QOZ81385.1 hypothetical protein XH83_38835 [Bradyrhizobium sp. CCBAU 53351]